MKRNLDGVYFRVKRNNKFEVLCWSDMTREERQHILDQKCQQPDALVWLGSLCQTLGDVIAELGNEFDLVAG